MTLTQDIFDLTGKTAAITSSYRVEEANSRG